MTLQELIEMLDEVKPNAYSLKTKVRWVNEIEGRILLNVLIKTPEDLIKYEWDKDKGKELVVIDPFSTLYEAWMEAKVDFQNGEYEKYQNTMTTFNEYLAEYEEWVARTMYPIGRMEDVKQIYLTDRDIMRIAEKVREIL